MYGVTAVGDTAVVAQADGTLISFARLFSPDLTVRSRTKLLGRTLIPPDGRNVYALATRPGRPPIAAYLRSQESGRLTPQPAPVTRAIDGASTAAISPDGRHVYVASGQAGCGRRVQSSTVTSWAPAPRCSAVPSRSACADGGPGRPKK